MKTLTLLGAALAVAATTAIVLREAPTWEAYTLYASRGAFAELALPFDTAQDLMDIGIADVDGDDRLDIYTSNHNARQYLWAADAGGGFRDVLTAWGLDQVPTFPGVEISQAEPRLEEPGVYVYWKGRNAHSRFALVVRAHRLEGLPPLRGSLQTYSSVRVAENRGMILQQAQSVEVSGSVLPRTSLAFSTEGDGVLTLEIGSPGLPIGLRVDDPFPARSVHVGANAVSPPSREIELALQDRHGVAWIDYNHDGRLDAFVSRGAIAGTLRLLPPDLQVRINDELLCSQPGFGYRNLADEAGILKRGCSGRKASWVDFDNDGLADLFVNCMDRNQVEGKYPKQLYRQDAGGRFTDVASNAGLGLAGYEVIDAVWFDADDDGHVDLLTTEAQGFFLHRGRGDHTFSREFVGRGKFVRGDNPQLRGTSDEYWFVDGKLSAADFDGNGSIDVFYSSKKGNMLLVNDGAGHLELTDPASRGLPAESTTGGWVDFDNDGLVDLYLMPQGLYRQRADRLFVPTGLLVHPAGRHMAAIANWADLDNDGRRDLVLARLENFSRWRWWERLLSTPADRFAWKLSAYRNVSSANHWLEIRLVGRPGNPQAIGARVSLQTADGWQTQVVGLNDGAFFSQGHYRLYFGLGTRKRADSIRVDWPDGSTQEMRDVEGDRLAVIRQHGPEERGGTR